MLGTDYPFDMSETDPVGLIAATEGLSDDEVEDRLLEIVNHFDQASELIVDAKEREEPLSVRHYLREVGWAIVFWYVIFFVTGAVEASPVDGWIALATMPWADLWAGSIEWAAGLFS